MPPKFDSDEYYKVVLFKSKRKKEKKKEKQCVKAE
jgi:hypothetical protein